MANKVEICGVNTAKLPVLSNDEKMNLFEKIKQRDKSARETFIGGNLRLVLSVIQRFSNRGENMDDLFQIGCIGLIKAIDNFDTSHNVKFSTYAVPMIIGEIRRYLRDNNQIRVSRSLRDIAYKALKAKEELDNTVFEGTASGGLVKVEVTGAYEMQSIKIDPSVVDADDVEMLEDLVVAAFNDAKSKIEDAQSSKMGSFGGLI